MESRGSTAQSVGLVKDKQNIVIAGIPLESYTDFDGALVDPLTHTPAAFDTADVRRYAPNETVFPWLRLSATAEDAPASDAHGALPSPPLLPRNAPMERGHGLYRDDSPVAQIIRNVLDRLSQ